MFVEQEERHVELTLNVSCIRQDIIDASALQTIR